MPNRVIRDVIDALFGLSSVARAAGMGAHVGSSGQAQARATLLAGANGVAFVVLRSAESLLTSLA
jgi:hypothetical protein